MKTIPKIVGVILTSSLLVSMGITNGVSPASANTTTETTNQSTSMREKYELEDAIQKIHEEVNNYRKSLGLNTLKYNYNIALTANSYAQEISTGTTLPHDKTWQSVSRNNLGKPRYAGENLAYVVDGATETVNASKIFGQFKNSEAHNNNLIKPEYTDVGYGAIIRGGRFYIVQRFLGYDNNPERYPENYFGFDNATDLPDFYPVSSPTLKNEEITLDEPLALENFNAGTFSHPTYPSDDAIRWYGEDYYEPLVENMFKNFFRNNPEGMKNLMWVGNGFQLNSDDPKHVNLIGKKVWAEYYKTSPYSSTPQKITVGPFIVQKKKIKNVVAPTIQGDPTLNSEVSVDDGEWSMDADYQYQWMKNGLPINGANSSTFTIPQDFGHNSKLSVKVTATKEGAESASVVTEAVNVIDKTPITYTNAKIEGEMKIGANLTVTVDWNKTPSTIEYVWKRNGKVIPGATNKIYKLTSEDIGTDLLVEVTANSVSKAVVYFQEKVDPKLIIKTHPSITGSFKEGSTLKANPGEYSVQPDSFSYQWLRDGQNIQGATKPTYLVSEQDVDSIINVQVTAKKGTESLVSTSSNKNKIIAKYIITGAVKTKYDSISDKLGKATGNSYNSGLGQIQTFEKGKIYSSSYGTFVLYNGSLTTQKYVQLGGEKGSLGYPKSDLKCTLKGQGCVQNFEKGNLYSKNAQASVYRTSGAIQSTWAKQKWENGPLGYPTSDEVRFKYRSGAVYQNFEKGMIIWSPKTGAQILKGVMLTKWKADGWERGPAGLPLQAERCGLKNKGCYQRFEKGNIYWSPKTRATFVKTGTAIQKVWGKQKWENGPLGYPTSDEVRFKYRSGAVYQNFEKGMIIWSSKTGAQVLKGAMLSKWKSLGWERSRLGLPKSNEYKSGKNIRQKFEKGYMTYYRGKVTVSYSK